MPVWVNVGVVPVWVKDLVVPDALVGLLKDELNSVGRLSEREPMYDPYDVLEELDLDGEDALGPKAGLATR